MPATGDMPMGSVPPALASSVWWLAAAVLLVMVARCQCSPEGLLLPHPLISLQLSRIGEGVSCSALLKQVAMVVDLEQESSGRLEPKDRVRAHQRRASRRSYGACSSSRRPAVAALLPLLLAEWRPSLFLLATEPLRRQFIFWLEATDCSGGSGVVPSGLFPGDGDLRSDWKMWTRSLFCISIEGPSCKVQGLACNFHVFLGPACNVSSSLVE